MDKGEIVLYQPDDTMKLEVRLEDETVWLSQSQMSELFQTTRNNVSMHISNIFKEGELEKLMVCKESLHTTQHGAIEGKTQVKTVQYYNLDVIISVGYRIKSQRGTMFRIWATRVIKDYLLKGYAINHRIERVEHFALETERRVTETEKKIDFFVKTALPPIQGIFFDGQVFDAYELISKIIRSAKQSIVLIDNYIDEHTLTHLSKKNKGVKVLLLTLNTDRQMKLDVQKVNAQYGDFYLKQFTQSHDRFLIIDSGKEVYHIGASLKDLGKKWFAFSKMDKGSVANIIQAISGLI